MSTISDYLDQISSAVYGREVRSAIHDAIEQCYEDATGNPDSISAAVAKVEDAQSTIETESAKISAAITRLDKAVGSITNGADSSSALLGTFTKSTIVSAANSVKAIMPGEETISFTPSDYDFIDVTTSFYGVQGFNSFRVEDVLGTTTHVLHLNIPDNNGSSAKENPMTCIVEFGLYIDTSGSTTISYLSFCAWAGSSRKAYTPASISEADLDTALDSSMEDYDATLYSLMNNFSSVKIYGRKNRDSTELADMRIGYDGTEYESAGAALRALQEKVDNLSVSGSTDTAAIAEIADLVGGDA